MAVPTLHSDDPRAIRREVLDRLLEATGSTHGVYHGMTEIDGVRFYDNVCAIGSETCHAVIKGIEGTRLRPGAAATCGREIQQARRGEWTIHSRSPARMARFNRLSDDLVPGRFRQLPVWREIYDPIGVHDQLRMLIYDRGQVVGWLGVWRVGDEGTFDRVHRARANRLRSTLRLQLISADALERSRAPDDGSLLLSADGDILFASPRAASLRPDVLDALRRTVRRVDANSCDRDVVAVGGTAARVVRMDSAERVAYLALFEPAHPPRLRIEEVLTPRQLEVAELAASGATVDTVADCLQIASGTVKYHLREVYARLRIDTRAELAAVLAADQTATIGG